MAGAGDGVGRDGDGVGRDGDGVGRRRLGLRLATATALALVLRGDESLMRDERA